MKKHISQMTTDEVERLTERVDQTDIASVQITLYTLNRFEERLKGLSLLDVAEVFLRYELIEYNTHSGDNRVLLRGTKNVNKGGGCFNVCLVYSLDNNRIITIWKENHHDHHDTLRIEEYSEDLEVVF